MRQYFAAEDGKNVTEFFSQEFNCRVIFQTFSQIFISNFQKKIYPNFSLKYLLKFSKIFRKLS